MIVDRYRHSDKPLSAIFVPTGTAISTLPPDVAARWKNATCDKKGDSLEETQPRVGMSAVEAIESIERNGYYEATAAIRVEETVTQ